MMKAVLLAAGQSKRMAPLPDKNFLPMCGRPLIVNQFEQLRRCRFKDVIVVGGRHNLAELKKIAAIYRDHDGRGRDEFDGSDAFDGRDEPRKRPGDNTLKITIVEQKNLSDGMAGAVLSAERLIKNDDFLVLGSNDVIEDGALKSLLRMGLDENVRLRRTGARSAKSGDIFLLAKKVNSYFPGGYLKIDRRGRVEKIIEKPGAGHEPSDLVNIVAHVHREPEKLFQALKKTKTGRDDRYEVALDSLIRSGVTITAVPYEGIWQAIKYPWHLLNVWQILFEREFESRLKSKNASNGVSNDASKATIAKTAIIHGDVIIEDGVKIFDHAVIQGPAYIGRNSVIANNALVRESHIGANCVIGFSSEIARSYLSDNIWTHSNYIGDSVIGANTSFGAGVVTANLRLDEGNIFVNVSGADSSVRTGDHAESAGMGDQRVDTGTNKFGIITGENVRVGVNTSIMPGVKIGNNSFVASGLCVSQNVPDNQFVYGRWNLEMKENRVKLQSSAREEMMKKLQKF